MIDHFLDGQRGRREEERILRIPGIQAEHPAAKYKRGNKIGGRYEVYGIIGIGGFGIVYLVYEPKLEVVLALKALREDITDPKVKDVFRREAEIWINIPDLPMF